MDGKSRLKEFRTKGGMTQQELADHSGISIRTIQRMERGLALGSPHTIRALAKSLNISNQELIVVTELNENAIEQNVSLHEDIRQVHPRTATMNLTKVRLLNFSILSVLILPFGNIIVPVILFFLNKKDANVNTIGRKIISVQIIVTFALLVLTVLLSVFLGKGGGAIPLPVFICYVLFGSVSIGLVIKTSLDLNEDDEVLKFFPKII